MIIMMDDGLDFPDSCYNDIPDAFWSLSGTERNEILDAMEEIYGKQAFTLVDVPRKKLIYVYNEMTRIFDIDADRFKEDLKLFITDPAARRFVYQVIP